MRRLIRRKTETFWKKHVQWGILLALLGGFLLGMAIEGLYELNTYRRELKGGHTAEREAVEEEYIHITDSIEKRGDAYYSQTGGTMEIILPERYINKLEYQYESSIDYRNNIVITTKNVYKQEETREIAEVNQRNLDRSVVNIQDYVTKIRIELPADTEIRGVTIDNSWTFNWYRVIYIWVFSAAVILVIWYRKAFAKRIEAAFLMICLSCGGLLIAVQPLEFTAWDEHIHFYKTFDFFEQGEVEWSEAEESLYTYWENPQGAGQRSKEEKHLQAEYLNEAAHSGDYSYQKGGNPVSSLGYLHMAVAVKIGEFLGLPFTVLYILGKAVNLLLYGLVMFAAIRILPVGKMFLTVLALMPTPLLQACSYTYDAVVNSFLALGIALIAAEFFWTERKITWKRTLLIGAVFLVGSFPKAVYIPLLLLYLLLPEKKFQNRKGMYLHKGLILLLIGGMLLSFLLPVAGGTMQGDERGGDTSVSGQIALILRHPPAYFQVFWSSVKNTFDDMWMGRENLSYIAYAGIHPFDGMIGIFCAAVALTEKKRTWSLPVKNHRIFRAGLGILTLGVVGLIWTALYVSFTEVGATAIAGVQGRYFVPLLLPVYFALYSDKVEGKWKESAYTAVLLLITLFIIHQGIYTQYFVPYNI